ncbi:SH3 domain-containing protein [Paraglaciecola sp. 2405UD69-4]|uniref:C40 family peptidase n=1 Tax=Paraglaciecola sp. 2405UD69-4 TaxID=3391836 RepID=UPI0039C9B8E3
MLMNTKPNCKSTPWIKDYLRPIIVLITLSTYCTQTFSSNVPDITSEQLNAQYWQSKLGSNKVIDMTSEDIEKFNQQLFATNPHLVDPLSTSEVLTKAELVSKINKISSVPSSARFYADGTKLTEQDFNKYQANLNIEGIAKHNPVKFGLVSKRSALRTFPTLDRVFNKGMDLDLDRFQETAVFPGEAVSILHRSKDGNWLLVQNYNYLAWVQQSDIAIGDKSEIANYLAEKEFLVVTGSKIQTNYLPNHAHLSEVQLDMGVKLPLVSTSEQNDELYGQSTAASYQVKLPTRKPDGSLSIETALIGRTQDVHLGYLAYTPQNIISQGFKFLGERYGWGHDYNARDCTGFIGEIYKTFGILMPRNSGQQGKGKYGTNFRFNKGSTTISKLTVINDMQVGDLIYIPGHVMMYLGEEEGQPTVIHDVKGLAYWTPEGEFYQGTLNAVSVTPLIKLHLNKTTSYVDRIYNIKRLTVDSVEGL